MTTNRRSTDRVHPVTKGHDRLVAGAAAGSGAAMGILSSMISGIIVWGGIGWLLDRWLETRFIVAIGAIVGLALSTYIIVVKYGRTEVTVPSRDHGTTTGTKTAGSGEENA